MKGTSEARIRAALRAGLADGAGLALKLPDDARNWKPADYLIWRRWGDRTVSCWLEVKDTDAVATWPLSDLRASQRRGILEARRLGIGYWLAVWWRRSATWTLLELTGLPAHWFADTSWPKSLMGHQGTERDLPAMLGACWR